MGDAKESIVLAEDPNRDPEECGAALGPKNDRACTVIEHVAMFVCHRYFLPTAQHSHIDVRVVSHFLLAFLLKRRTC